MRNTVPQRNAANIIPLPHRDSTATQSDKALIYVPVGKLFTHPNNLRRVFPEADVREMAASIKSKGGVYQALLIVPKKDGLPDQYYVVDGNMRLAGARMLGCDCPVLKCEIMTQNEAEQLLAMAVTCTIRYTPDPISQALHYKRLIEQEKYSVTQIADLTGIHRVTIEHRLKLLNLDDEIQELIAQGSLPMDPRAADALLSIENRTARTRLAQRLSADQASIKTIETACRRLNERLAQRKTEEFGGTPALSINRKEAGNTDPQKSYQWKKVRSAARQMCEHCDMKLAILNKHPEPAWALISHAAEQTCSKCTVREIAQACAQCPAVTLLHHITREK